MTPAARTWSSLLLLLPTLALGKKPVEQAPEPHALPAATDAASLYGALEDWERQVLDEEMRVITFGERIEEKPDRIEMLAISIGTLRQPPEAVLSALHAVNDYPDWVTLHPSYKTVEIVGASRMRCGVGDASSPKPKRVMTYEITPSASGVEWRVLDSGTQIEPDSSLVFEVAPHPKIPGASLVVHRQFGLLPDEGRLQKYLASDDKEGRNRWWKDSNRHAKRLHWAIDAALAWPPGAERKKAYVESYQREFGGKLPYWAQP
jgi:hypothetical protein